MDMLYLHGNFKSCKLSPVHLADAADHMELQLRVIEIAGSCLGCQHWVCSLQEACQLICASRQLLASHWGKYI